MHINHDTMPFSLLDDSFTLDKEVSREKHKEADDRASGPEVKQAIRTL
jgi:hypothetical protein